MIIMIITMIINGKDKEYNIPYSNLKIIKVKFIPKKLSLLILYKINN